MGKNVSSFRENAWENDNYLLLMILGVLEGCNRFP